MTDVDDLLLAINIQLALVEQDAQSVFGKYGVNSSQAVACRQEMAYLKEQRQILTDQKLCASMAAAVESDRELIESFERMRMQCEADAVYARSLAGLGGVASSKASSSKASSSKPSSSKGSTSKGTSIGGMAGSSKNVQLDPCVACFSNTRNVRKVPHPCNHTYCGECLIQVYLNGLKDRFLIPARCCKTVFPEEWASQVLSHDQLTRYNQLKLDRTTKRQADPEFVEMVTLSGYRLCKQCGAGVERKDGCAHMTCICSYEFCYTCSAPWNPRQCQCPLYTEEELEQILNEVAPRAPAMERQRLRQVYQHHDEHQHRWIKIDLTEGQRMRRCPTCHWVCNQWYWRCHECRRNACGVCAFNR